MIHNDYEITVDFVAKLKNWLLDNKWEEKKQNPDFVFVVGGDGTFLKAFNLYQNSLECVTFFTIKSGNLGFYSEFLTNEWESLTNILTTHQYGIEYLDYLEVSGNELTKLKIINELKVINEQKPVSLKIEIDNNYLETFKGSGVCFATSTGSTGYSRSERGAILFPELHAYQLLMIAACTNINYQSINSPLILSSNSVVKLSCLSEQICLIADTIKHNVEKNEVLKICLKKQAVKIAVNLISKNSFVNKLNKQFVKEKQ